MPSLRIDLREITPKLYYVLRQGYSFASFRADFIAGLTVAIVALPLAMALAVASGATPEKGLHTAIIAGFLISALGGSKVQVGGPTAALIPVVFNTIDRFGYDGLILCTIAAGVILLFAGLLRVGALMRYMPQPVITGFTAGIAVTIFSSQLKDALGLQMDRVPAEFSERWQAYAEHIHTVNPYAALMSIVGLAMIMLLKQRLPKWPSLLIVVCLSSMLGIWLPVATIGSTFGDLPSAIPAFALPQMPFERIFEMLPSILTIAFLVGVESLLSAVVADGMTGGRHRSNAELFGQGIANITSALFAGLPATGALARTATNVRSGARTPIAGMLHAVILLGFMLLFAPLMRYVPLPALAAVLLMVAWNMSEIHRFRHLMRAPIGDRVVLLVTFGLTVAIDLTVAIEVGIVLAAFLFMHRMSEVVAIQNHVDTPASNDDEAAVDLDQRAKLPPHTEAYRFHGPLFFAVANRLDAVLDQPREAPRVFILRMGQVPLIDASGVTALEDFLDRCKAQGTAVILSGVQDQPRGVLSGMDFGKHPNFVGFAGNFDRAIEMAEAVLRSAQTAP